MAARGVRPGEGNRVTFTRTIGPKAEDEWVEGYVVSELDTQFTILTDEGRTYYKFYTDYGTEWKRVSK